MNQLLIANIGKQMMTPEAREHEVIDIKKATQMIRESSKVVFLTGAGISVSSGLPTYRGNDGVWTKTSKNYTPEEIATKRVFEEDTEWSWEYYRGVIKRCEAAEPNNGHKAIVALENHFADLGKGFQLVTTNIDDLHARAGSRNFFELHGNCTKARCTNVECRGNLIRAVPTKDPGCPSYVPCCKHCEENGSKTPLRPHILWFDEGYEEELHRIDSVFKAVEEADLLITMGGTCTTGGPRRILQKADELGIPVIDINPKANDAICEVKLMQLVCTCDEALPKIVKSLQRPPPKKPTRKGAVSSSKRKTSHPRY
jgi:NAD-dependent deacetylase